MKAKVSALSGESICPANLAILNFPLELAYIFDRSPADRHKEIVKLSPAFGK